MRHKTSGQRLSERPLPRRNHPLCSALAAGLTRVRVGTLGLGIRFSHVCAGLGCTVVLRPWAVIDLGRSIEPNQTRATAGSGGGRGRRSWFLVPAPQQERQRQEEQSVLPPRLERRRWRHTRPSRLCGPGRHRFCWRRSNRSRHYKGQWSQPARLVGRLGGPEQHLRSKR